MTGKKTNKSEFDELISKNSFLFAVFDTSPDLMLVVDKQGKIVLANKSSITFSGKNMNKLMGKRGGHAMGCVNAFSHPKGCGYGKECKRCLINTSVENTMKTKKGVKNVLTDFHVVKKTGTSHFILSISTSYLSFKNNSYVLVVLKDMTELTAANKKLKEKTNELNYLLNNMNDFVFVHQRTGHKAGPFTNVNDYVLKRLGYSRKEIFSMKPYDIALMPEKSELKRISRDFDTKKKAIFRTTLITKKRELIPVEMNVSLFLDNNIIYAVNVARDISDEIRKERKRRVLGKIDGLKTEIWKISYSQEDINTIIQRLLDLVGPILNLGGVSYATFDGKTITIDKEWAEKGRTSAIGYKIPEIIFSNVKLSKQKKYNLDSFLKNIPPAVKPAAKKAASYILDKYKFEHILLTPIYVEGKLIGVVNAISSNDVFGKTIRELFIDISRIVSSIIERRRLFEDLTASESKYRHLFEKMSSAFALHRIILNKKGKPVDYEYVEVNDAFEVFTGLKKEKVIGKKVTELIPGIKKDSADWIGNYGKVALTGKSWDTIQGSESLGKWFSITAYSPKRYYFVTVFNDMTDIKKAEIKIIESEKNYRNLFEKMTDGYALYKLKYNTKGKISDAIILEINEAYKQLTNLKRKNLTDVSFVDAFDVHDKQTLSFWYNIFDEVNNSGKEQRVEIYSDRLERWYTILSYKTNQDRVAVIITDVTEVKNAQLKIAENEKKYRGLFEGYNDSILIASLNKKTGVPEKILEANQEICKALGYSKEELLSMHISDIAPDMKFAKIKKVNELLSNKGSLVYETRHVSKNDISIPIEIKISKINFNGETALLGVARDISERKMMEKALISSEKYYRLLIQESSDIIIVLNKSGAIRYVSNSVKKILGYTAEEVIDMDYTELLFNNSYIQAANIFRGMIAEPGSSTSMEFAVKNSNGEQVFLDIIAKNQLDDEYVNGIVINARDITDKKRAEENLKKVIWSLEKSNSELEQFAYVASHDLKEPLRMISNYLELLEMRYGKTFNSEAIEFINYALGGTKRMYELIQGLLAFSRISRADKTDIVELDLKSVIKEAISNITGSSEIEELIISDMPVINGSKIEMVQLFQNLISNSVKFRSEKPLKVEIYCEELPDSYTFYIKDNGIGIEKEYHEKIFKLFERLHTDSEYSGTGIGLTICKKIVESHGGSIHVDPAVKNGTSIYFTLRK